MSDKNLYTSMKVFDNWANISGEERIQRLLADAASSSKVSIKHT